MDQSAGIVARYSAYLDRYVRVGVVGNRVIAVDFPTERPEDATADHPVLDRIERYLDGVGDELGELEVALTVDADSRSVLDTVREIPHGSTHDIATVAKLTPGIDPDDTETVAAALAANPVPLVIPDHRVVDGPSGAPSVVVERLRALEGISR